MNVPEGEMSLIETRSITGSFWRVTVKNMGRIDKPDKELTYQAENGNTPSLNMNKKTRKYEEDPIK